MKSRLPRQATILVSLVALAWLVTGCTANQVRETVLSAVGTSAGVFVGERAGGRSGAVVGGVIGALVGREIARNLNDREQRALEESAQRAVSGQQPTNSPVHWESRDPERGQVTASGWVVPTSDVYRAPDGRACRDVEATVQQAGESGTDHRTTLCETSAGAWSA